jgi:hypothetical protein
MNRKLNVSRATARGATAVARVAFDEHVDDCQKCQPHLCQAAETLWRAVCLAALKSEHADAGGTVAAVLAGAETVGHPADQTISQAVAANATARAMMGGNGYA